MSWQGISSHGRACLLMAAHVFSWRGMSSQGGVSQLFHGKACHLMAGHVLSWRHMSSHGGACQLECASHLIAAHIRSLQCDSIDDLNHCNFFLILSRTIILILYSIIKGLSRRTHF